MRRIITWASSTIALVVLLFTYHTSTSATSSPLAGTVISSGSVAGSSAQTSGSGGSSGNNGSTGSSGSGGSSGSSASKQPSTITGSTAQAPYGPVQVELKISGSSIAEVNVLQYPSGDGQSAQISNYAIPVLVDETMQAQSSSIDMVSGATYTSTGYLQSLQSALDQASL